MAADVSERTLHDVYLRPWKAYAEAGGRGAMMAHNSVNAAPCHASAVLMGWLRSQGAMAGALLASDMCDVGLLGPRGFRVAANLSAAAALALGAGLDQELCNPTDGRGQAYTHAAEAVAGGALAQAALDRAAANALRPKFAAGLFDGRAFANASQLGLLDAPAHRALARAAAAEGSVLLKNTPGLLPLALAGARIALIGPNAGCGDGAPSCAASLSQCGGYTNGGAPVATALSAGLNASTSGGALVTFAAGCAHGGNDTSGFAAALAAAAAADVVVFVGGDSGGLGWNQNSCGEDDDRADLDLPGVQAQLLDALLGVGRPVVLVLVHGRPVTFTRLGLLPRLGAVLAMWRPGAEGGSALWDMLGGRVPPSGRLAQSWVRRVGQVRSQASPWFSALQGDFDQVDYNGDVMAGLSPDDARWSPAWPFMGGISYTAFSVSGVSAGVSADGRSLVASANVSNTGAWPGKQVLGLFFSRPLSALVRSHLALAAFAKSDLLAPGAWGVVSLSAPLSALASYDPAARADAVEPGVYELSVRTDSDSVVPGGTFLVTI